MPLDDMTNFVPERASELVEMIGRLDQSPIHVYETPRQRERVYLPGVYDVEVPVEVGATRFAGDRFSEILDVGRDGGIVYNRQLSVYLRRVLTSQLDFLILRDGAASQQKYARRCE
jgi:hypothetical protein